MPQTAVLDNPMPGSAGDPADQSSADDGDIVSRTSGEATKGVLFGLMVAETTTEGEAKLLAANTDKLGGIVTRAHFYSGLIDVSDGAAVIGKGLPPGATFGVARNRRYYVIIEANVAVGDEVHVRAVATSGELAGAFRGTKDTTDTIDCSGFASWVKAGEVDDDTGYGVAVLQIDGPFALATADS